MPLLRPAHAAPAPLMCGNTLAHEHARPRCGLEHIVNTFDLQGAALFVCTRANFLCDALGFSAGYGFGRYAAEVGFAPNKKDGDLRSADRPYFLDPLQPDVSDRVQVQMCEGVTNLHRYVLERVWSVDGEGDENDMRFRV